MKKATLYYVIFDDNSRISLPLETLPLTELDDYTANYQTEEEFLENYPGKEKIRTFLKNHNAESGAFQIVYTTDIAQKELIPIFYHSNGKIVIKENPWEEELSELEKARRLLFNSKNQIFARSLLSSKSMNATLLYQLSLNYGEYLLARKKGLQTTVKDQKHYIKFRELLHYRANYQKLGPLRAVYEDMLELWKEKIEELSYDDQYYYARQLRILIDQYQQLKTQKDMVTNLQIRAVKDKICLVNHNPYHKVAKRFSKIRRLEDKSS